MAYTNLSAATPEEFIQRAASFLADRIRASVRDRGECIIGLSGGSTPRPIYTALGSMDLPWDHVRCFLVDERCVGSDHAESNQRLLRETLVMPGRITEEHAILPQTNLPIDACVIRYAQDLMELMSDHLPDLLVLGMGDDGHIASLFPPVPDLCLGDQALVIHTTTDRFAVHDRITVSLNLLAGSGEQVFLLGEKKRPTWEAMEQSTEDEHRWPAKRILQSSEEVTVIWGP